MLRDGNLLLEWALNLMVLNVSTRKFRRAVRLPEGDLAKARGFDGTSKSAVSRRFVALSRKKMPAWLASDLDGARPAGHPDRRSADRRPCLGGGDRRRWLATSMPGRGRGGDGEHCRRPGLARQSPRQGARSDAAPAASSMARRRSAKRSRNTFGVAAAIQRCQVHKGRNIIERLPLHLHASVKKALRQAWDRTTQTRPNGCCATWPGVWSMRNRASRAASFLTVRPPRPAARASGARSPAPTSSRTRSARPLRQVTERNVKRWRHASDGPPPACWRPRKPSVASRPIVSCPSSEMLSGTLEKGSGRQCH